MDNRSMEDREFQELLPFYINGTLEEAQKERVRVYLEHHPESQRDVAFVNAIRQSIAREAADMDPLDGYEQFKARIDASISSRRRPSTLSALWGSAKDYFSVWGLSPAVAVLMVMVVGQLAVSLSRNDIGLTGEEGRSSTRSIIASAKTADIKIVVKAGVTFESVTALLLENNCKISWGPSQQGEYWLTIDQPGKATIIAEHLSASLLLDNVQVIGKN